LIFCLQLQTATKRADEMAVIQQIVHVATILERVLQFDFHFAVSFLGAGIDDDLNAPDQYLNDMATLLHQIICEPTVLMQQLGKKSTHPDVQKAMASDKEDLLLDVACYIILKKYRVLPIQRRVKRYGKLTKHLAKSDLREVTDLMRNL